MKLSIIVLLVALGVSVALGSLSARRRAADKTIHETQSGDGRFVDFGVNLLTVRQDLKSGEELIEGCPPLVVTARRRFGGMFDTLTRTWDGPSRQPVTWYVSEDQEQLVLHDTDAPKGQWMQGSMGAGKTTAGAMWLGLRVIKHATHKLRGAGVTAPTDKRMEELRKVLFGPKDRKGIRHGGLWPSSWFAYREGDQVAVMATGLQIDFRSTHVQSAAAGSPIQGQNWAFCLSDELQDYIELDGDIIMRGRSGWKGRYERFVTATPKRSSSYRTFKGKIDVNPDWNVKKVSGPSSPFIWAEHWETARRGMSAAEALGKVFGEDGGAERAVYPSWVREANLVRLPQIGVEDVTNEVLAPWGGRLALLIGHDPGTLCDVSVILRAYRFTSARTAAEIAGLTGEGRLPYVWWVVGELTTRQTTTNKHVAELMRLVRNRWACNLLDRQGRPSNEGREALVRVDPSSNSGNDELRPHETVRTIFRTAGFAALEAAYIPSIDRVKVGQVPRKAGIEMIDALMCNDLGERRLFVDLDENGDPVAPNLVKAFEEMERDESGRAEHEKKDEKDLSHWPAALRYALWAIERPRYESPYRDREGGA